MDWDRRGMALYSALAALVGVTWVWAASRLGGPGTARALAWLLGTAAALAALGALTYRLRASDRDTRHVALAVAIILLAGASGVAAAAHLSGSVPVSGTVPLGANGGLVVNVDGANEMVIDDNTFVLSGTINVVTEQGNATFFSSGSAEVTVAASDLEGTWTNLTGITADPNTIQVDPDDKPQVTVGQTVGSLDFTTMAADDLSVDFVYSASGPGEVTVNGLPANTQIFAIDRANDDILDNVTTGGSGTGTFDSLNSGSHDVLIQTNVNTGTPQLSNQSPTGGLSSEPTQLSVDVTDQAFQNGDTVDVTFTLDGTVISTQTVTSSGTVTASIPASGKTGGSHSWQVDAKDDFGNTASSSHSYSVPNTLSVYNESAPTSLINDRQVTLTVYTRQAQTQTFTTSDGTIDLTGFPVSDPFVVVAEAEDLSTGSPPSYIDRRVFIQNAYETQSIFLLPENRAHRNVVFQIDDYTGSFPPRNTTLQVQRSLNGQWRTVLGDYFGAAEQFEAQLRYNTRHRLVLRNAQTGERRVLGTYTPLADAEETIVVSPTGGIEPPDQQPSISVDPSVRTLPAESGVVVDATVSNGTFDLQSWSVDITHISPSGTGTTLYTASRTDSAGGTESATLDLSGLAGEVKVETTWTTTSGATGSSIATYNLISGSGPRSMPLLPALTNLVTSIPANNRDATTTMLGMVFTVVGTLTLGSYFRLSTEGMGVVTAIFTGVFAILGWLPYSLLFTVLALGAALAFLRRRY